MIRTMARRRLLRLTFEPPWGPEKRLRLVFTYARNGIPDARQRVKKMAISTMRTMTTIAPSTRPMLMSDPPPPPDGSGSFADIAPEYANTPPSVPRYSIPSITTTGDMQYCCTASGWTKEPKRFPSRSNMRILPPLSYSATMSLSPLIVDIGPLKDSYPDDRVSETPLTDMRFSESEFI